MRGTEDTNAGPRETANQCWETDIESQARDCHLASKVWRREESVPRGSVLEGKQPRKGQAHAKAYRCGEGVGGEPAGGRWTECTRPKDLYPDRIVEAKARTWKGMYCP